MDDLEMLRAFGGPDPVPDPAVEARARTALLTRTMAAPLTPATGDVRQQPLTVPRRRWGRRIAVPVAAAVVVVATLVVIENAGPVGGGGGVVSVPGIRVSWTVIGP